jgi:hypothetical protein
MAIDLASVKATLVTGAFIRTRRPGETVIPAVDFIFTLND